MASHEGWNPRLYEWWFTRNPEKVAIRAREEAGILAALDPLVTAASRVAEAGAGTGHYTLWLARRCASVLATDASPAMLAHLEARAREAGLDNVATRRVELPDGISDPESMDVVVAIGVLNYVEELGQSLRQFAAVLVAGGSAVFTVPLRSFGGRLYAFGEALTRRRVRTYSRREVAALAADCGLEAISFTPLGFTQTGFNLLVVATKSGAAPLT